MAGNCSICFHSRRKQIDAFMAENANYAPILKWIRNEAAKDTAVLTYRTKAPLKKHREVCLGLPPLQSVGTPGAQVITATPPGVEGADVSDEEITKRARNLLADKLSDLSAKELQAVVVEGMKLERAKHAAAAKSKPERDEGADEDEEAMDEVRRASAQIRPRAVA